MEKLQLVELVRARLGYDGRLADRTLAQAIDVAWTQILRDIFQKAPSNLDFYAKRFDDEPVLQNPTTKEYYVTLPAPIIQSINISDGVRRVLRTVGRDVDFVPITGVMMDVFSDLDVYHVMDSIPYEVRKDKIVFLSNPEMDFVKMDLVIPFTAWNDTDEFPLPAGEALGIVGMVVEVMSNTPYIPIKRRNINPDLE